MWFPRPFEIERQTTTADDKQIIDSYQLNNGHPDVVGFLYINLIMER